MFDWLSTAVIVNIQKKFNINTINITLFNSVYS